jgi:SAM-dependent methyltransferase
MTQPSPLAVPQTWNLVADAYFAEVMPWFETFAREALRLAAPQPGARIVDVACGPGTLTGLAAAEGLRVDAIDFSPAMLDHLHSRKLANVNAQLADGQALPFPDDTFAAGFSLLGLVFFPDRARGFAELARVLAPGARAVVSSWPPMETVGVLAALLGAVRETMGKVFGQSAPADPTPPLSSEESCVAEMGAAFRAVEVHRVRNAGVFPSADALWSSFERSLAPIALMRAKLGPRWPEVAEPARAAIRRHVGDGPYELEMTALLSVGTAP